MRVAVKPSFEELAARVAALEAQLLHPQALRERMEIATWAPDGGTPRVIGLDGVTQDYAPTLEFPSQVVTLDAQNQRVVVGAPESSAFGGLPVPEGLTGDQHPAHGTSTQTMSTFVPNFRRLVMPQAGTLTVYAMVATSNASTSARCAVYATDAPRARLAHPTAVALSADGVHRWIAFPTGLAVSAGQQLDVGLMTSNTGSTVIALRSTALPTNVSAAARPPAAMWPSDGAGATVLAYTLGNQGALTFPATIAEAAMVDTLGGHLPQIYGRVA